MFHCQELKQDWITIFNWLTHIITTMWIKYVIIWIVELQGITEKHIPWTEKADPVIWLSGFWTKLSRRSSFPSWHQSKIPYLFLLIIERQSSHPAQNSLADLLQLIFTYPKFCSKHLHLLVQYQNQTGTIYLFLS